LNYIQSLLIALPEQEASLLTLLTNKLGDIDRKVASKASHLLSQLILAHPAMVKVVVDEIERFLWRPNVGDRARYYGIVFLNQIVLGGKMASEVPERLIEIYFSLFENLVIKVREKEMAMKKGIPIPVDDKKPKVKKPRWRDGGRNNSTPTSTTKTSTKLSGPPNSEGIDSKMMTALLTGVNRAFPFTNMDDTVFDKRMDTLFTVCHMSEFSVSVQSLLLIFQVMNSRQVNFSFLFFSFCFFFMMFTR